MNLQSKFSKIAEFHKGYEQNFLASTIKHKDKFLRSNKEGLFFIFSYCFYQGRRDELSEKFQKLAKKTFDKFEKREQKIF